MTNLYSENPDTPDFNIPVTLKGTAEPQREGLLTHRNGYPDLPE